MEMSALGSTLLIEEQHVSLGGLIDRIYPFFSVYKVNNNKGEHMKRNLIIGAVVIISIAAVPLTVYALGAEKVFKTEQYTVDTFTDRDYRCYVAYANTINSNQSTSISCMVKSDVK